MAAPDPVAIAEKMIAAKTTTTPSIYDTEPLAGWVVALTELKAKNPRVLSWKMIATILAETAHKANENDDVFVVVPAGGFKYRSISTWVEKNHPDLFARTKIL